MKLETVVLIPNYNGERHLEGCLSSLKNQTYKKFKTIVIDNNSTDGSLKILESKFPEVEVLKLDKNYNFAKSMNTGIKYSLKNYSPKFIAVLNNDVKVDKSWLKNLVKKISSNDKIAAVASNMLSYDNASIIDSQGGICDSIGVCSDVNKGKKEGGADIPEFLLSSCWGASLISVKALKRVGFLDGDYVAYVEDLDWGWRANLKGYKILFEGKARVYHKGSASWNSRKYIKKYLCLRNSLCTLIKNYELRNLFINLPFVFLYYVTFSAGYFLNRTRINGEIVRLTDKGLFARMKYVLLPVKVVFWNILNIRGTLKKRVLIQKSRKISDKELIKLMNVGFKEKLINHF